MHRVLLLLLFVLQILTIGTTFACKHAGKTYKDGDEWKEKDVFIMRCVVTDKGWKTEVVACLSPTGQRIPLNTTLTDGNDEWKCAVNENGMITLQQGVNANANCDQHKVGDKWQDKSFEFECLPGGQQKLLGCLTENGVRIGVGESKEINGYNMKCEQYQNGTVILHGTRKASPHSPKDVESDIECVDRMGQRHKAGSSWIENQRFNKTCTLSGRTEIQNCITQNGLQVPLNGHIIDGNTKYTCEKTDEGAVRFASGPVDKM